MSNPTHQIKNPLNMDGPVCDFCLAPKPRWSFTSTGGEYYHAGAESDKVFKEARIITTASENWASCSRCATIIEAEDPERLARAVLSRVRRKNAHLLRLITAGDLESHLQSLITDYTKLVPLLGKRRRPTQEDLDEMKRGSMTVERVDLGHAAPDDPEMN